MLLADLARHPEVAWRQDAACGALVLETLRRYPRYANLGVADSVGNVFCSALPLTQPVSIADRAYFRQALERRDFALGECQVGRITGKASVNAGYPVLDRAGRVQAVVFAALGLDWLNALVAEVRLPRAPSCTSSTLTARSWPATPIPSRGWAGRSLTRPASGPCSPRGARGQWRRRGWTGCAACTPSPP